MESGERLRTRPTIAPDRNVCLYNRYRQELTYTSPGRGYEMALLLFFKQMKQVTLTPRTVKEVDYIVVTYRATVPRRLQNVLHLFALFRSRPSECEQNPTITQLFCMVEGCWAVMQTYGT